MTETPRRPDREAVRVDLVKTACVRPGRIEDAARMGAVFVETYRAAHRGQVPDDLIECRTPEQSARGWERALRELAATTDPDWCIYVAQDEREQVVGIAVGRLARPPHDGADANDVRDGRSPDHPTTPDPLGDGEVNLLYVQPAHQGRGHGRHLVHAVARFLAARGVQRLVIGVLAINAPARGFYERIGGRLIGYRPYEEDGHVMEEAVYAWDLDRLLDTVSVQ